MRRYVILIIVCVLFASFCVGFKISKDNTQQNDWIENREVIEIRVAYGDTLDEICYEYKPDWMDVREFRFYILELNNMDNSMLYAGQTLKVYREVE